MLVISVIIVLIKLQLLERTILLFSVKNNYKIATGFARACAIIIEKLIKSTLNLSGFRFLLIAFEKQTNLSASGGKILPATIENADQGFKILQLLRKEEGAVTLSRFKEKYKLLHGKSVDVPSGITFCNWIESFNSIGTQKGEIVVYEKQTHNATGEIEIHYNDQV